MTEHCEFKADYLEEVLRDRLVCGLRNETIQRKLLTEAELSLKKAYDTAHGMEIAFQQASELQASNRPTGKPANEIDKIERGDKGQGPPPKPNTPCYRCGRSGHAPDRCYYKSQVCRRCHRRGHIARVCKGKPHQQEANPPREQVEYVGADADSADSDSDDDPVAFRVNAVIKDSSSRIMLEPIVAGVRLPMELDTGASVSIVSQETVRKLLPHVKVNRSDVILKTYSGERLKVLGEISAVVEYDGQPKQQLPLIVVEGQGPTLFGRSWLAKIRLDWHDIKKVYSEVELLLRKYDALFQDGLGTLKDIQAKLMLTPEAIPKFFKPRPVPYALRGAIEQELDRLEKLGVLQKISHSDWAAPLVPVPKADGSIRLCGDYKVTVNPVLQVDQFPMPRPNDLFATLAGEKNSLNSICLTHINKWS